MTEWDLAYMRREVKPQPEPIAWGISRADGLILDVITPEEHESHAGEYTVPLYAAPPAAPAPVVPDIVNPITDEQIDALWSEACKRQTLTRELVRDFARAVLSAAPVVPDGAVPPGSWEHLKVMMQHSAWGDTLQLSDALANIDDFAKSAAPPAAPAVPEGELQPIETIRYWLNSYSSKESGDHFLGHGMVVTMLREYLQLRESAAPVVPDDVGLLEYRGNSVSFIYDKMRAYRDAIDAAWKALSAAHMPPDGKTSVAEAIAKLSAAPVVRESQGIERMFAVREGLCNADETAYFAARPQLDDRVKRRIFIAGFYAGWDRGIGGGNG